MVIHSCKIIKKMSDIAICFGGQPRCLDKAFADIKKYFNTEDFDVFAHLWKSDDLLSSWGHNMGFENKQTKVEEPNIFVDLYKPKHFYIEDYKSSSFYNKTSPYLGYRNMTNKIWSSMSQFYSMKKSFDAMVEWEEKNNHKFKYAAKFRMDFDIDWDLTTEPINEIKRRIDEKPNTLFVNPGWNWPNGDGISALLAIGSREVMLKYSLFYEQYLNIIQNNPNWSYDESNIKWYVEKICGIEVEECQISVGVYR